MQSLVVIESVWKDSFRKEFFTWNITLGGLEEKGRNDGAERNEKVQIVHKDFEMTQRKEIIENNGGRLGSRSRNLETLNVEV